LAVGITNLLFTQWIPQWYGKTHTLQLPGMAAPVTTEIAKLTAIWAVQAALLVGILMVLAFGYKAISRKLAEGSKSAVSGALLAAMNTASEYGFGAVIASLPGFLVLADWLKSIPNPLVNEAITVTLLAGITGSASGGMSIALAAMSEQFISAAHAANIPLEVLHRVAAMASGGMDNLPHNGAITPLAVTGLTSPRGLLGIFCITLIKTLAAFVVIGTSTPLALCEVFMTTFWQDRTGHRFHQRHRPGDSPQPGQGRGQPYSQRARRASSDCRSEQFGGKVGHHPADVSDPAQIADMIAYAEREFGGVDIWSTPGIQHVARWTQPRWSAGFDHRHQPVVGVPQHPLEPAGHAHQGLGPGHQHCLGARPGRLGGQVSLCRRQARGDRLDQSGRAGNRDHPGHLQRDLPRLGIDAAGAEAD
jgi:hypothetical protein